MRPVFWLAATAALCGACIPQYDFTGDYDMTWDAVLQVQGQEERVVKAGSARVTIRAGLQNELLVDLGPDFCRVTAEYVEAMRPIDTPYFTIPPQPCWFGPDGRTIHLAGTGEFSDGEGSRLTIVTAGTFDDGVSRGSATLDFSESW